MALDLPDEARDAITAWRGPVLARRKNLRPVAPEALHLTLCFLGSRPAGEVDAVVEAALGACEGLPPARLSVAGIAAVPPRRPRLYALELNDSCGCAAAVQGAVAGALADEGLYEPEKRPFWPHITFARVRRGARAGPLRPAALPPAEAFEASRVTLYRSMLRPQGALYEPLARARLGRG